MQTKTVPCPERVCSISLMFGVINYTYTGVDICINRLSTAPRCESSIIFCMTTKHTQKQLFLIASLVFQCKIRHRFWHYLPSKVILIKNLLVVWWFNSKFFAKVSQVLNGIRYIFKLSNVAQMLWSLLFLSHPMLPPSIQLHLFYVTWAD